MSEIENPTINQTLLMACAEDLDEELKDILMSGNFDIGFTDGNGDSACHYAARNGSNECLKLLLHVKRVNVNLQNKNKDTPLHCAVRYAVKNPSDMGNLSDMVDPLELVDLLLDGGADPRIENRELQTPLMLVEAGNEDLRDLLENALAGFQMDDSVAADNEYDDDVEEEVEEYADDDEDNNR